MTNTNMFVLAGNVTKDVDGEDFGYLPSGAARLNFSIAVNRSKKQGDSWVNEVSFFSISYFGKPAESIKKFITKGSKVVVSGYIKQDRWEKDGQKFNKFSFIANSVELCGGKKDGDNNYPQTTDSNNGSSEDFGSPDPESFKEDIPF